MKTAAFLALTALAIVPGLKAQQTEVSLTSAVNANIQTYTDGFNYQVGGTTLTVNGISFGLALDGGAAGTTGVVQSPNGNGAASGPFSFTFSVPTGTQATALYSLANTAFGSAGFNEGELVVTGTGGETASLQLVEGDNIRDHNQDGFVNTLTDPTVVPTYFLSGAPTSNPTQIQTRLDMQEFLLPSSFNGDTIASITFDGTANAGNGSAFLAGLTLVDAVSTGHVPDSPLSVPFTAGVFALVIAASGMIKAKTRRCLSAASWK